MANLSDSAIHAALEALEAGAPILRPVASWQWFFAFVVGVAILALIIVVIGGLIRRMRLQRRADDATRAPHGNFWEGLDE